MKRAPAFLEANDTALTRRAALRRLAALGTLSLLPGALDSAELSDGRARLTAWLESQTRADGGYAWPEEEVTHLTPTFAVLGCYQALGMKPPRPAVLAEYIRTHHPFRIKKLERDLRVHDYHQIQGLLWLGAEVAEFKEKVAGWTKPSPYPTAYERDANPPFQLEVMTLLCRELLQLPCDGLGEFRQFVLARQRANGSFGHTPASDQSDGHVMHTWWGLQALRILGIEQPRNPALAEWLSQCQLPSGGFTYRSGADIGGLDDVAYTWAAVHALKTLGTDPANRSACVRWLKSLRTSDGGIADRPGWAANPRAAYLALDTLKTLGALDEFFAEKPAPVISAAKPAFPRDLKIFTIQLEAHGQGSPSDAVELARELKVHLWGAKNARPGWIERAQALARERQAPVTFCVANEEYGTYAGVPGLGTYSHISDLFAPAGADFGTSLAGSSPLPWPEFRQRRHAALEKVGGRLFWQFGEQEEYVRAVLDDSLQKGGFAAISTFHFGNPDFLNSESFLYRWRGQLPFVALQDAHGSEPWWWSDKLAGFRTVFLAREATWDGWLEALKHDWVAAIRHDAVSGFVTWMHGGVPGLLAHLREREAEWKWWGVKPADLLRAPAVIAVLRAGEAFEAGAPKAGMAARVRCLWECTVQGAPKKPLSELLKLALDGEPLAFTTVESKGPKQARTDHYYLATLPELKSGPHRLAATVRRLETVVETVVEREFTAP